MSNEEKLARLKETIDLWKGKEGALMPVMHEAQELFGCLEESTQEFIAQHLGVLKSQVYGVATFYSRFTVQPREVHHQPVPGHGLLCARGAGRIR